MPFHCFLEEFIQKLEWPDSLPERVEMLYPFERIEVKKAVDEFYQKYYSDGGPRIILLGINPGRFGAGVTGITFSPDGQWVLYAATIEDRHMVLVDDHPGAEYDGIGDGSLSFSPDSKRVAYGAMKGNKSLVVVDGQPVHGGPHLAVSDFLSDFVLHFVLDLDPEDIGSVSVLSPVQAHFRYGSDGGNGALVIETRRPGGRGGE